MEDIHQHNPYRLYLGNNLTTQDREKAIELQKNRIYICLLAGTDLAVNAIYCATGYYQLAFSLILSLFGYIGALSYNKYMIIAYIMNIILLIITKLFLLFLVIDNISLIKANKTGTLDPIYILSVCFWSLIVQILIFYYVLVFHNLIANTRRMY